MEEERLKNFIRTKSNKSNKNEHEENFPDGWKEKGDNISKLTETKTSVKHIDTESKCEGGDNTPYNKDGTNSIPIPTIRINSPPRNYQPSEVFKHLHSLHHHISLRRWWKKVKSKAKNIGVKLLAHFM